MVLQCLPLQKQKSTTQVSMERTSENPFSLHRRSRTHSLSPGSLCSPRARRRPSPCITVHVPTQPGVSTTRVHAESPSRSHFVDDWYLNRSDVPPTPPPSPLVESVWHNGGEILLMTGVWDRRLQLTLSSSRLFRGSGDEFIGDSRMSGRPHAGTLTHSIRRHIPFITRKQAHSSIDICWPLKFLEKFRDA